MPDQNDKMPEGGRTRRRRPAKQAAPETAPRETAGTAEHMGATVAAEAAPKPPARRRRGGQGGQNAAAKGGSPGNSPKEAPKKPANGAQPKTAQSKAQQNRAKKNGNKPADAASAEQKAEAKKPVQNKPEAKKPAAKKTGAAAGRSGGRGGRRPRVAAEKPAEHGAEIKTAAQTAAAIAAAAASTAKKPAANGRRRGKKGAAKVRIIPLGGLGEVGKNLTVYECGGDAFIVDCGLTFPDESMPGVDLVIPDFSYILENRDRIKGIAITHGHEDHIGAIPYLLKHLNLPLYGTRLTLGLIEGKLKEHGLLNKAKLHVQKPGDIVKFGSMEVEFINVNHSIPDACAFAIHTPAGIIIQTGDFKIDYTPIGGEVINLARFGELGSQGVLALLSDSTNAERPGSTASERTVGDSFDKLFGRAKNKRIIVASFSSNVHRLQQIVDAAVKYKRKVAVSGRSMENVVGKALEIGYLDIPSGVLVDVDAIGKYQDNKVVVITTGSQGEPMSALTRMAMGDHRKVNVTANDCIIISATPIPGNEKLVSRVINELMRTGAEVVYEKMYDIHVSGHACQDEQKLMISLTRPKFFVPMHGEYKHLKKHADLALAMGIDPKNVIIGDIGRVIETDGETMAITGSVTAGKVLVDGLGVGDVGSVVLRDRKHLAQDGLIVVVATIQRETGKIVSGPDVVSRGFVYVKESEDMMDRVRTIVQNCIQKCVDNKTREWGVIKNRIRDDVGDYLWQRTKRTPMILPVIQEI